MALMHRLFKEDLAIACLAYIMYMLSQSTKAGRECGAVGLDPTQAANAAFCHQTSVLI